MYTVTKSRPAKQFLSSWDSPPSSETLIIFESIFQKLLRVLFTSLEIDKQFTDIWLIFDLHTNLLLNTAQPNGALIAIGSPLLLDLISCQ